MWSFLRAEDDGYDICSCRLRGKLKDNKNMSTVDQLNSKLCDAENTTGCLGFLMVGSSQGNTSGRKRDWGMKYESSVYKSVILAVSFFPFYLICNPFMFKLLYSMDRGFS